MSNSERAKVNNIITTTSAVALWTGSRAFVQMVVMAAAALFGHGNYGAQT